MKKFISLIIIYLLAFIPTFATELKGGVSFDVNSARQYLQEGQSAGININQAYIFKKDNRTMDKIVYSYNNNGQTIGITVLYKSEPNKAYIYGQRNNLIYVEKYDTSTDIYPHRGYRYNLDGQLVLTCLVASPSEQFRFDADGNLIAHSINGIIYDEQGNVIGRGK